MRYAAAAAEEDGRPVGRQPRSVGGQEQIRLQFLAMGLAYLPQIGRADLLAGLDDEFGIEAELAAARLAHGAQAPQIDAVLALVVGGAAAIDALAFGRGLPGIEIVAPFAFHAVDDIAMAIGEHGRQRGILAIVRQQIRPLAARRFDQAGGEIERGEGGLQVLDEIGAQRVARGRDSGFRSGSRPCGPSSARNAPELRCSRTRAIASARSAIFSFPCSPILWSATYRDTPPAGSGMACRIGLANPARMQQFQATARR